MAARKNVLIVGLGEVGSHLARVLSEEGHAVTVIDNDAARLQRVTRDLDVQSVLGDGSRPDVLDKADTDRADLLLAVSNDDNVNMLTCLFGKRIGAKRAVLRVHDLRAFRGFRTFFRKNLMFDSVLSLDDLAAEEVVKTIRQNVAVGVENYVEGKVQLRILRLKPNSPLVDKKIMEVKLPSRTLIAAIDRNHEVLIPSGQRVMEAGDELLVIGEPKGIASFEKKTGVEPTYLRKVVMYGSSGVVPHVCEMLRRLHVEVRLIVPDKAEAVALSESLDRRVEVLHGEGTDINLLKQVHAGEVDAFLGLSDRDELNLMSCQLAKHKLQTKRTVALVQKPDYAEIYEALGIDRAVSPRLLCANRIAGYVRGGGVSTITSIEEGRAEVLEFSVGTKSPIVGTRLADTRLPEGCRIAAIVRDNGDVVVPTGDDVFADNDTLVAFVMSEVKDAVLKELGIRGE